MRNKFRIFILLGGLVTTLPFHLWAQPALTLRQAIANTLEKNHSIRMAQQDVELAANNAARGNAGFLPSAGISGGAGRSINDTRQRFVSGQEVNRNGAQSCNLNANAFVSWTLFDGGRMFATYDRLQVQEEATRLQVQLTAEQAIAQVMQTYFSWVLQHQLIQAQQENIQVSEERIQIARARLDAGKGNKLDWLQAQMDRNAQGSARDEMEQQKLSLLAELNRLQGLPPETAWIPADTLPLTWKGEYDSLRTVTLHQNRTLKALEKNIALRRHEIREQSAARLPSVSLDLNYGLNRLKNEVGFLLFNNTLTLSGGVSATWILYQGGNVSRQRQNALITLARSQTDFDRQRMAVEAALLTGWKQYERLKNQIRREEDNYRMSQEALDIALERFRTGSSSALEMLLVQQSVNDARIRLATTRNQCNQAILNLMVLDGGVMVRE